VLRWIYQYSVYPQFSYLGYLYNSTDSWDYGVALGLAVAVAMTLPVRISQPSHFIAWLVYVVAALPSMLVPHYGGKIDDSQALRLSVEVAACALLINLWGTRGRALRGIAPRHTSSPTSFWAFIFVYSALVYAYMTVTIGAHFHMPSLTDVYDVRAEYKAQLGTAGLLGYLLPIQANVINPVIMLRGLYTKRWLWLFLGFFGEAIIFAASGLKSVIFAAPALITLSIMFTRTRRPAGASVIWGVLIGTFAALGLDRVFGSTAWTSISVRRFLITPGLLTGAYVYVFSPLDKGHFAYSLIGKIVPGLSYSYHLVPTYLVGEQYFGRANLNANASLFADGFANLGFAGMLIEALVLVVTLWVIDSAARGMPLRVSAVLFTLPAIALANASSFTALTTHGIAAGIVVCMFAPRTGWGRRSDAEKTSDVMQPASGLSLTASPSTTTPYTHVDRLHNPRERTAL